MNHTHHSPSHTAPPDSRDVLTYTIGFVLSIVFTLAAFWFSYSLGSFAIPLIVGAACIQLFVQITFFLHLGSRSTPSSWRVLFLFSLLIIAIVIGGTLWIMHNLDRLHMMPVTNGDLFEHGQAAPQNERY